jgi:kynureninase
VTEPLPSPQAVALDARDALAPLRERFHLPLAPDGRPAIYLCGHSLGPQPRGAAGAVRDVLEAWGKLGVRGHHEGPDPWLRYHEQFAAGLGELVGAAPRNVVAMNTLTVNLHLMLAGFYRPTAARHRILIERGAFPSDRHAVVSQLHHHGLDPARSLIEVGPRQGDGVLAIDEILAAIATAGDSLALVLLPGVQYLTGQLLDIATLTAAARGAGAVVGWDLAHAIGNVPVALEDSGADFAVWCHYKYLCAGPGAVGGAFVHPRHAQRRDPHRLAGWWGHDLRTRFQMGPDHDPTPGADGWQLSNPPILSLAPLGPALALYTEAGAARLRAKSLSLSTLALELLDARCAGRVTVVTPRDDAQRGCQLSLRISGGADAGRRIYEAISARGVVCDWREPDLIRLAALPLYNTHVEVDLAISHLATALAASP